MKSKKKRFFSAMLGAGGVQLDFPANFTGVVISTSQVNWSWDSVVNATSYSLERATQSDYSDASEIYSGATTSFNDTGRTSNTTYYYRVRATAAGFTPSNYSTSRKTTFLDFSDITASFPTSRYAGNPVVTHDATYINYGPGGIIEDPTDSSQLLFYMHMAKLTPTRDFKIGLWIVKKNDPYTFIPYGDVITGTHTGDEAQGVRFGCVLSVGGTIYYYYGGVHDPRKNIKLATSTDGRNFTKQGVVFQYNNITDWSVFDPAIIIEGGTWYMLYTWENASFLPKGIRLATSSDGITWSRTGTNIIGVGTTKQFDGLYIVGCSFNKFGSTYTMLYTATGDTNPDNYTMGLASSSNINAAWTKDGKVAFDHSLSGWDNGPVSAGLFQNFDDGNFFFWQGGVDLNGNNSIGIAKITSTNKVVYPPGFINGYNGWTADDFFDVQGDTVLEGSRSLKIWANTSPSITGLAAFKSQAFSVGDNLKYLIRAENAADANVNCSVYLQQGTTQIAGVKIQSGNIYGLTSAGWAVMVAISSNTTYEPKIVVDATNQVSYYLNDTLYLDHQAPLNNITTGITRLQIERAGAISTRTYLDNFRKNDVVFENFE